MSSAVEQLAKGANWKAFTQATELKQRIMFVLGALLIYRLGTYIPVPGIDPVVWKDIYSQKGGGILDMLNMFSGGFDGSSGFCSGLWFGCWFGRYAKLCWGSRD